MSANSTEAPWNESVTANLTDSPEARSLLAQFYDSVLFTIVVNLTTIISVWIVAVNGLTLAVYARFRQLQKKRNALIISLAAVDLFTGLTPFLPKLISRLTGRDGTFLGCLVVNAIQLTPPWASMFHLVSIAIERHVAITRPLMYHVMVTSRRLAALIALDIGLACFITLIPLAWPRDQFQPICLSILWYPMAYRIAFFVVSMASLLFAMFLLYLNIYRIARRQERAIAAGSAPVRDSASSRKDSRATQVFILISGIALACYVPFWISTTLLIAMPENNVVIYCYYIAVICLYSNSGMNFIVYTIRNSEFRSRMKMLFRRGDSVQAEGSTTD